MIDLDALQDLVDRKMSWTMRISVLSGLSPVTGLRNQFGIQSINSCANGVAGHGVQSVGEAAPVDYAA